MLVKNGILSYKMLIGKHYHSLEENRRISLPKRFRQTTNEWVLTRGIDGELLLFPTAEFTQKLEALSSNSITKKNARDTLRLLTNEAEEVAADKQGRIQIPEYLADYAALTKHVVVVGSLEYIEIWDRDTYHTYADSIEKNAVEISEHSTP